MKKIILSIGFILFSLCAVGVRIFELKVMIDSNYGFYFDQYSTVAFILCAIAIIGCINFGIGALLTLRKESKERTVPNNSFLMGGASLVMALGILADAGNFALYNTQTGWADYLVFSLSLLTAVTFAVFGIFYLLGKKAPTVLSLLPIVWSVAQLITNYTEYNSIALTSENLLDVISLALFMVFWLYHGKLICGMNLSKTFSKVLIFGSVTSVFGLISTLPRFFVEYGSRTEPISSFPMVSFSNLSGAIYIICFMGILYFQKKELSLAPVSESDIEDDEEVVFVTERPSFIVETIEINETDVDNID